MSKKELISEIVDYFEKNIFTNHINAAVTKHASLKSYVINPIVVKYLSKVLEDDYNAEGVAKALFYPRVLETSITTSFGTGIQKMFVKLKMAEGSKIKGMDIEFYDKIDKRKKWCQIKSGPNTINSEDVQPLIKKFTTTIQLARTNSALSGISNNDFIVGLIYGEKAELSMHYKEIDKTHPVIIAKDFWHRVTGYSNFYEGLVTALHKSINSLDTQDMFKVGLKKLTSEIKKSKLFKF